MNQLSFTVPQPHCDYGEGSPASWSCWLIRRWAGRTLPSKNLGLCIWLVMVILQGTGPDAFLLTLSERVRQRGFSFLIQTFKEICIRSLAWAVFLIVEFWKFFIYKSRYKPSLFDRWSTNIFSHAVACLFIVLCLWQTEWSLISQLLWIMILVSFLITLHLISSHKDFLFYFLLKVL